MIAFLGLFQKNKRPIARPLSFKEFSTFLKTNEWFPKVLSRTPRSNPGFRSAGARYNVALLRVDY